MIVRKETQYLPGTKLRVFSKRFLVFHVGIVDWPDFSGNPTVIHAAKGSVLRSTPLAEFLEGGTPEVLRVPQNLQQQQFIISRMRSQFGKPYDVLNFNCEHAVSLAETGTAHSGQLAFVLVCLIAGAVYVASRRA